MGDMNVHLVMAMLAFSSPRTRHQLRLRSYWFELDYFAQIAVSPLLARFFRLRVDPSQRTKPNPGEPDKSLGIGLLISARFLETSDL
jgi:hypothetical protein